MGTPVAVSSPIMAPVSPIVTSMGSATEVLPMKSSLSVTPHSLVSPASTVIAQRTPTSMFPCSSPSISISGTFSVTPASARSDGHTNFQFGSLTKVTPQLVVTQPIYVARQQPCPIPPTTASGLTNTS